MTAAGENNTQQDVRWLQRFSNYRKALAKLRQAVEIVSEKMDFGDEVDELLQEGLIQRFEYTHELAWKVMKDYAEYQGYTDIRGSRDAIRKALAINMIDNARWMESIEDRNQTSHNYDDDTATLIYEKIVEVYFSLFCQFENTMIEISKTV
jgi:nucleotidyltransferase substrate binding protein (TIGR01987 family)